MLFVVLLGLIASILLVPFGRFFRSRWCIALALIPISLFCYFMGHIPIVGTGTILLEHTEWVPSLGLDLDFRLDGLSLLFGLLITGIGSLIFIYSSSYLKGHIYLDRFYGFLCLFMASMLGMVLADNILLLFVFWELTSISSFFLIGFNNRDPESRRSAVMALSITGLGGLFLMAGMVLIGQIAGTYSIHELMGAAEIIKNHSLYPLVIGLVFIGAFTKSAQFPFHFWLPGAMKAPTPVSAYLHSATMVKAGIFLLMRFSPILGDTPAWSGTLLLVGGFTMLYAGIHSLFRTDLKGVLAYSTISALGILTFLIGLGTKEAMVAVCAFIIAHALYKATLFLVTGIIDHETGTRDLTQLSGLGKVLFPVFIAGGLAALSSAGMPLFLGFIGKDLIYEATLNADQKIAVFLTIIAVITNICLVAAGLLAGVKPFVGDLAPRFSKVHLPYASMWAPPLVLAVLGLVFGVFPGLPGDYIVSPTVSVLSDPTTPVHLRIWHGFNTVLVLSLLTLAVGALLYAFNKPSGKKLSLMAYFNTYAPKTLFTKGWKRLIGLSTRYSDIMHNGFLRSYLLKIIVFAELLLAYELFRAGPIFVDFNLLSPISIYEAMNVFVLLGALYLTVTTSSRLTAVVATSIVGFTICLMFVFYGAPDLAMTQFTIDTLTVVLFVFVLFNLPPFLRFSVSNKIVILRDAMVALSFGSILSLIAIMALQVPTSTDISDFYGESAYTLAKGKNVVNVILVDFRGFDTMFEIIVLSIAAIGVYSLLKLRLSPSEKE